MLQALIDKSQENVTGTVRLKLFKGAVQVVGRKSPRSLYSHAFATFEKDTVYDQRDAEGFIRLNALRLRIGALASEIADDALTFDTGSRPTLARRPRDDGFRRRPSSWRCPRRACCWSACG